MAHRLQQPWGTFTPILVFLRFFVFELWTDGQTDRRTGKTRDTACVDGCMIKKKQNTIRSVTHVTNKRFIDAFLVIVPRLHSYCLSLQYCLQWYNVTLTC